MFTGGCCISSKKSRSFEQIFKGFHMSRKNCIPKHQVNLIVNHPGTQKVVVHPRAANKSFWLLNVINEDIQPHLTNRTGFFHTAPDISWWFTILWGCNMIEPRKPCWEVLVYQLDKYQFL
jgi:hypothetical protein